MPPTSSRRSPSLLILLVHSSVLARAGLQCVSFASGFVACYLDPLLTHTANAKHELSLSPSGARMCVLAQADAEACMHARHAHASCPLYAAATWRQTVFHGAACPADTSKDLTGMILKAVENSGDTHHLVVCTLCSCYPVAILGMSPSWYKSRSYRARAVREPRAVLKEFGTVLPANVKIVVHDSNADTR